MDKSQVRVGIVVKPKHENAKTVLMELIAFLEERQIRFVVDPNGAELVAGSFPVMERLLLPKKSDLVVVLGGDGTLLAAARYTPPLDVPIIGINLGRVGFLTEIPASEMGKTIDLFLEGKASFQKRMMLETSVVRDGRTIATYHCLNDAVITKAALARIMQMKVSTKSGLVADVFADGLILSTPTGSTAYNLAAGGPIVMPQLEAMILTPLCPQTLSLRPILLPAEEVIDITLMGSSQEVFLTADGQIGTPLMPMDRIVAKKSPHAITLVRNPERDYFSLLREKLGWAHR